MRECEICGDMTEAEICLSCTEKKLHRTERWMKRIMRREAARWRAKRDEMKKLDDSLGEYLAGCDVGMPRRVL